MPQAIRSFRRSSQTGFIIVESPISDTETTTRPRALPPELEPPRAKLVYLYLQASAVSIDRLQSDLRLKKITLYSILRTLRDRGLVDERDGRFAVVE